MALFGGIVCGAGVGLVLSASATTGGTDLLAAIVQHFHSAYFGGLAFIYY